MTCRICLEDCDEKTTCACIGFVHAECQQKWMRISKRRDCEICHTPFYAYVEYNPTCVSRHPHGLRCGDDADNALFTAIIFSLSVVYFTMLIFCKSWQMVFFIGAACRIISVLWLIPLRHEVYLENVWLWWQFSNCIMVCLAHALTYTMPLEPYVLRSRVYVLYLELFLLLVACVFRWLVGFCRAARRQRFTTSPDRSDTMHGP